MKNRLLTLGCAIILLSSCSKVVEPPDVNEAPPPAEAAANSKEYVQYTIKKGDQYSDKNGFLAVNYSELTFKVRFDSSAIYTTTDPANQKDVNKLFGFSDNNADHHVFSARFGWRWSNNALRLFAYTYNNSTLSLKEMGTVPIGSEATCSIKVTNDNYIFSLNKNATVTMPRLSKTPAGSGYQLFPYFGGNETAPHDIKICIKRM